ncbi:hypothetical protein D3C72_2033350 [compost metagenome]
MVQQQQGGAGRVGRQCGFQPWQRAGIDAPAGLARHGAVEGHQPQRSRVDAVVHRVFAAAGGEQIVLIGKDAA